MPSASGSHPGGGYRRETARYTPEDGCTPLASLPDLLAVSTAPALLSGWWASKSSRWRHSPVAATLREARDQIAALKEEVDRLVQPPSGFGIFLEAAEDGRADVFTGGRKKRVSVSPGIDVGELKPGQEVALNVVIAQAYETIGEVVMLKEVLEGGDQALVISHADEERIARLAEPLRNSTLRAGDSLLLEPRSGYVYERIPQASRDAEPVAGQASEGKSFFLNIKGPELLNKYVGETERHIRLVFQRAREKASEGMPVIVFFDEMDSIFRTRGSGVSSDVENTIVPQLLSEIDGVEGLENVIVIGASNREDMIDPAILRPGRLDVKIKIERPDAEAARDIFSKYVVGGLPLHPDDLAEHGGSSAATVDEMIQPPRCGRGLPDQPEGRLLRGQGRPGIYLEAPDQQHEGRAVRRSGDVSLGRGDRSKLYACHTLDRV